MSSTPRHAQSAGPRRRRTLTALAVPLLLALVTTAAAPGVITLKRGDTLSGLAATHGTTVAELQRLNGLTGTRIYAGRTLRLPGATAAAAAPTAARSHTVVRGDTLIGIAARYGVTTTALAQANNLRNRNVVRLGTTLAVPGAAAGSAPKATIPAPAGRTYPAAVGASADAHRAELARRNLPGKDQIRAMITATAEKVGVDPKLARAVAYQESGFQAHLVSPADAVGPMQVLPGTADWMSQVAGRRLDVLDPADNILAGVLLLRTLLRSTGGDVDTAVAGYYQGLRSVRERGMYTDTKAYVRSVNSLRSR